MDDVKPKCADKTDLFFSELGHERQAAIRICQTCPLLEACRERVLASPHRERGVWGGMSEGERAKVRRMRRRVAACGTESGYYRHVKVLKEVACPACRAAHNAAETARYARREPVARTRALRVAARRAEGWCWECVHNHHKGCIGRGCCCPRCSSVAAA